MKHEFKRYLTAEDGVTFVEQFGVSKERAEIISRHTAKILTEVFSGDNDVLDKGDILMDCLEVCDNWQEVVICALGVGNGLSYGMQLTEQQAVMKAIEGVIKKMGGLIKPIIDAKDKSPDPEKN